MGSEAARRAQRRWRERHPEEAAAHLAKLKAERVARKKPRKPTPTVTPAADPEQRNSAKEGRDGHRPSSGRSSSQRIEAVAEYKRITKLAAKLDQLLDAEPTTDARLRLRMDYARTLSVLRDRLRRIPEEQHGGGDIGDQIAARWRASQG